MDLFLLSLPFLAIALLVLIPTRRLFLAGWPTSFLVTYYVLVVGLASVVAELRAPARYLVPILVVMYIAPFVTAGAGLARLIGGRGTGDGGVQPVVRHVYPIAIPPATRTPGPGHNGGPSDGGGTDDQGAGKESNPDAAGEESDRGAAGTSSDPENRSGPGTSTAR